ncbi:MAG: YbaK/EbsC family protein, partial [Peptoniphilaceae bacterium]
SDMLGIEPARCTKAVDLRVDGEPVFVFVPGDRELNQKKLENYLGVSGDKIDMLDEETILELGTFPGFTGPVGLGEKARIIVDRAVTAMDNMVVGANKENYHTKNVNYGRDFEGEIADDLLDVAEGDVSPAGEPYTFREAFEVARIKKPSEAFSEAMNLGFLNDEGKEAPYISGGATWRTGALLAAVLENHRDENGPNFPLHLGPYDVAITVANVKKEEQTELAEKLYDALAEKTIAVLLDDRNERAGVKFKDRDLLGIPLQLTVGKDAAENVVELKRRAGDVEKLPAEDALQRIADALND